MMYLYLSGPKNQPLFAPDCGLSSGGNGQTPPLPPLYEIEIVGTPSNENIGLFAHEARARWPSFHVNGHGGWVANLSEDARFDMMDLAPRCGVIIHITKVEILDDQIPF
jgi:hypothetical protein